MVSFNANYPEEGLEVREGERLPIMRKELDTDNICELDPNDNTIQFNKDGYYKISFIVSAYIPYFDGTFDPNIDLISLGFKLVGDETAYLGASKWFYRPEVSQIMAQGIITVPSISNAYELINLSKRAIYLKNPDLKNISGISYFPNAPVSIIVEYLGK